MNRKIQFSSLPLFRKVIFYVLLIFSILLNSCVVQHDLEYMKAKKESPVASYEPEFSEYHLQPNDALYIQISSLDDIASNVFAQSAGQQPNLDPYSAYMSSYTIDQNGYVQLPVIGKIHASGRTTLEVVDLIKDSVENILSLPVITVKLVNQYVSVLGAVRNPGHYVFSQEEFTIFNALGLAGDITIYGNRKEVMITRNENGKVFTMNFDLTSPEILSSKYYYIQPNDMIYVKSMNKRFWGMEQFPFVLILTTITTGLLIYSVIQQ